MVRWLVVLLSGLLILTQFTTAIPAPLVVAGATCWAVAALLGPLGPRGGCGGCGDLRVVLAACACGQHFLTTATPMGACGRCASTGKDTA